MTIEATKSERLLLTIRKLQFKFTRPIILLLKCMDIYNKIECRDTGYGDIKVKHISENLVTSESRAVDSESGKFIV